MNDRQLHDELERRSDSANVNRDWARRELLPAVSAAIETRPQRVATSRGPALAGLASVAGIILVLVVALPRVVPLPPVANDPSNPAPGTSVPRTSLPAPMSLEILSAQEFAVGVLTGRLLSSTVLVDGTIGANFRRGPLCPPPGPCYMGRLERTDPSVDVSTRWLHTVEGQEATSFGREGTWRWWHLPSGPITGTLLLSVNGDGLIEFLGRVDAASAAEPKSVAEATEIDLESLALDEVVLVEGWLNESEETGVVITIDCTAPEFSILTNLPSRYCQPTDSLTHEPQPGGSVRGAELGDVIRVQRSAAQQFGTVEGTSQGIFALAPRLYGGGCAAEPPCDLWEVVARLSDVAPTEPKPTLTPTPTPTATPTLPSTAREIECAWPPLPPEMSPDPAIEPLTVRDETGLVAYCGVSDYLLDIPDGEGIATLPIVAGVAVGWSCEIKMPLTFRAVGDEYEILAERAGACTPDHGTIQISFTQSIPADKVRARLIDDAPTPTPTETSEAGNIVECSIATLDTSWPAHATIHDETGLIESCHAVDATNARDHIEVGNPDGDPRALQVTWGGAPCDGYVDFGFARALVDGPVEYVLAGKITWPTEFCIMPPASFEIRVSLREDVNAGLVAVSLDPFLPQPAQAQFDCDGAPVTVMDHAATVQSCAAAQADLEPANSEPIAANPDGDPRRLVLMWMTQEPSACGPVQPRFTLSLYARDANSRFVAVTGSNVEPGTGCAAVATWRVVELVLAEPVLAEDVEFAGSLAATTDTQATRVGEFQLSITAGASEYGVDEPIAIEAALLYGGVGTAELSGSGLINGFEIAQLDGSAGVHPIWIQPCNPLELPAAQPLFVPFFKSGGIQYGPTPFDRTWFDDPELTLPVGTWLVTVYSGFVVGDGCGGERVSLKASVVVVVR